MVKLFYKGNLRRRWVKMGREVSVLVSSVSWSPVTGAKLLSSFFSCFSFNMLVIIMEFIFLSLILHIMLSTCMKY